MSQASPHNFIHSFEEFGSEEGNPSQFRELYIAADILGITDLSGQALVLIDPENESESWDALCAENSTDPDDYGPSQWLDKGYEVITTDFCHEVNETVVFLQDPSDRHTVLVFPVVHFDGDQEVLPVVPAVYRVIHA